MLRVDLRVGHDNIALQVRPEQVVMGRRHSPPPALADVPAAVAAALEQPLDFPPLRQALTPDDHVAVIVSEQLARLPSIASIILEYLLRNGLSPERITLICPPRVLSGDDDAGGWHAQLPPAVQAVQLEVHEPGDRSKLSYLASTKAGRRVYLNRTLVDADQLVIISPVHYDPVLGYAGGLGNIFPWLSDEATRSEFAHKTSDAPPDKRAWPARQESQEVGWLLGMPFLVNVVEGLGDEISHICAGSAKEAMAEAARRLDEHWHVHVDRSVDLVVAAISGRHDFADVSRALACAARVVTPGGRIVVLSRARHGLGPSGDYLRQSQEPAQAVALVRQQKLPDAVSAWQLAAAAQRAQLYLLSELPAETAEEMFFAPVGAVDEVQRLVQAADSCLFLPDAHRTLAVIAHPKGHEHDA